MDIPEKKKIGKKSVKLIIVSCIMVMLLGITVYVVSNTTQKNKTQIISQATLQKVINVSELSTYEAVYNGVAKVMNVDNPERVDYYVSYEAKVKAGIDFEDVDIQVNDEQKIITVVIPQIEIKDVNVDIASLDYIFENKKANTATVSEQAYKKCIEDVTKESSAEKDIYDLAGKNAENIIEALIRPFVEQLDTEYQLIIRRGGATDEENH